MFEQYICDFFHNYVLMLKFTTKNVNLKKKAFLSLLLQAIIAINRNDIY